MAKILARAVRGFQSAFGIPGQQTSPQDLELTLPAQTVADATQIARYGSARNGADGWLQWSSSLAMLTGSGFYATTFSVRDDVGARDDDVFWIYNIAVHLTATVDLADWAQASLSVIYPPVSLTGTGAQPSAPIWLSNAALLNNITALTAWAPNRQLPFPMPYALPRGAVLAMNAELDAAAGTVTARPILVGRLLGPGVPPLP